MSRYILIRRLRGPAFLLLVGALALLNQGHILGWDKSWPLFLILLGVMMLAERAALAAEGGYPQYSGGCCGGASDPNMQPGSSPYPAQPETAIVPAPPHDLGKNPDGGQS